MLKLKYLGKLVYNTMNNKGSEKFIQVNYFSLKWSLVLSLIRDRTLQEKKVP